MSEFWVGQIIQFGGNYAIRDFAQCDGQLLPIANYTTLFALIYDTYGGDGRTTMALPDLRGRSPMHQGRGPGLSSYALGQRAGYEGVTLSEAEMPSHQHGVEAGGAAAHPDPNGKQPGNNTAVNLYSSSAAGNMDAGFVAHNGSSQSHGNMAPSLCVNFQIALTGIFPSRS